MPKAKWSAKDDRQYKAIFKSCFRKKGKTRKSCASMAAAVVNKRRTHEGRTWTFRKGSPISVRICSRVKGNRYGKKSCRWVDAVFQKKSNGRRACIIVKIKGHRGNTMYCESTVKMRRTHV